MSVNTQANPSRLYGLASWATSLRYEDIPPAVIDRTKDFFLDTFACTLGGRDHAAIIALVGLTKKMGPASGPCEVIPFPEMKTSPAFAALVNGACSHVVEQDDLHNYSIMHPATVVFPSALAVAQDVKATGREFLAACVVGYEFACRTGEFLGPSHYKNFHTTATAGVIGACAASSFLLKQNTETMLSAIGTAGTQAAGLWQFLIDATHSKQVHTGHACFNGVCAAYLAGAGLLGPTNILEGAKGMGHTLSGPDIKPSAIDIKLGEKWSVLESSFKWHASCRHTHPSVDALLKLMSRTGTRFEDIEAVKVPTYQAAINVLSLSEKAETVHQSKFSMGFVLAVAAKNGHATINDFTEDALEDKDLREFQKRVTMVLSQEVEDLFPEKWTGKIEVRRRGGGILVEAVNSVKGDPDQALTRDEIEAKARNLAAYGRVKDMGYLETTIRRIWSLETETSMLGFAFQ